jgi:hypothetical protein
MSWQGSDALVWDAERLRIAADAADAAGIGLWSWNVDTDEIAMDERAHALWGVPRDGPFTFADLSARIAPPDLDRVRAAFAATRTASGPYQFDFRILLGDGIRWVSARGRGADEGIVGRVMFGAFLDSTARKEAEEAREMLAGEMSHRVKNLFSIAASLASMAARSAATTTEMERDLRQRLATLGRAHDLIRPVPGDRVPKTALLGDLLAVLLAAYDIKGVVGGRRRPGDAADQEPSPPSSKEVTTGDEDIMNDCYTIGRSPEEAMAALQRLFDRDPELVKLIKWASDTVVGPPMTHDEFRAWLARFRGE